MRWTNKLAVAVLAFPVAWCRLSQAQTVTSAVTPDPVAVAEAARADALYKVQNYTAALPLYEDLHQREPNSNFLREHLAVCLLSSGDTDEQRAAAHARARQLLLDAKAAGDNSNFLQIMLEKLSAPTAPAPAGPPSPGMEPFRRAEKLFSSGELPAALAAYKEAMAADPKLYEAPLFAGDTEYKLGHYPEADDWYARAAAINPNRETAYRYWGDCLMKQGERTRAEAEFIDAIVAEPYSRTPRVGLKQWADANKAQLAAPPIALPPRAKITTSDKDGFITSMTVGIDSGVMAANKDSPMLSTITAYEMGSSMWVAGMFHKTYPTETRYRHSLAEEVQTIHVALSTLAKTNLPPESIDATWRTLAQLDKDGMLECWILLDHPDQGIAQDYVAFRANHRDLLHQYIAKYEVHPK
jgi:tetratricopeptide (TPR) repeat protein